MRLRDQEAEHADSIASASQGTQPLLRQVTLQNFQVLGLCDHTAFNVLLLPYMSKAEAAKLFCRQIESMTSSSRAQDQARRAAEARLQGQLDDLEAEYQAVIEAKQDLEVWLNHTIPRIV